MFSLPLLLEQLYSVVRLSLCVQSCHPRADIFWLNGPTTAQELGLDFSQSTGRSSCHRVITGGGCRAQRRRSRGNDMKGLR